MRIDRRNPIHWYYLIRSGVNVIASAPFRALRYHQDKPRIIFYDQMNGNAKALADYLLQYKPEEFDLYFLAFPPMHQVFPVDSHHIKPISMLRFRDMITTASAAAVITPTDIDTLVYYQRFTNIPFVNVWHGIGFRDHMPDDFRHFRRNSYAWVTSLGFKKLYQKWGWAPQCINITGYGRIDQLVSRRHNRLVLLKKYKIDNKYRGIILVAPTWKQKDASHNPLPFNTSAKEFLAVLNKSARKTEHLIIFRPHLQSGNNIWTKDLSNVRIMPAVSYPNAEEMMFLADMMIVDWSSIAFDYLVLERPTIFLNVQSPYQERTTNQQFRYGPIVNNLTEMTQAVEKYARRPEAFAKQYGKDMQLAKDFAWGDTLDGKSVERYYKRLKILVRKRLRQ